MSHSDDPNEVWNFVREHKDVYGRIAYLDQEKLKDLASKPPSHMITDSSRYWEEGKGWLVFYSDVSGFYRGKRNNKQAAIPFLIYDKYWHGGKDANIKDLIATVKQGRISIKTPIFTGLHDMPAALVIKPKSSGGKKKKKAKKGD